MKGGACLPVYDLRRQGVVGSQVGTGDPQHGSIGGLVLQLLQQSLAGSTTQSMLTHLQGICTQMTGSCQWGFIHTFY